MSTNESLFSLFENLHKPLKLQGTVENTATKYRIGLHYFAEFLGHVPTPADLTDERVTTFLHWLPAQGLSIPTANSYGSKLVALWATLAKRRIAESFPGVRLLREPRKIPVIWTQDQLSRLWNTLLTLPGLVSRTPASVWWTGINAVIYDTGERISAVLALKWDDLDEQRRWIISRAENRKGKTEDLAFKLHRDTLKVLKKVRRNSGLIFQWPLCRHSIWLHWHKILEKSGLPNDRKHCFQCMRRTTASFFEAVGGNATELLGHSERRITKEYYLNQTILNPLQPSEVLRRPGKSKGEKN